MSEFRDAIRDVVADREPGTAELCISLPSGRQFAAEYEEIAETELNTELGRDAREQALLHVSDRSVAAGLANNQRVKVFLLGSWTVFLIVRRKDDPGDPQVEFGLVKMVEGKDR